MNLVPLAVSAVVFIGYTLLCMMTGALMETDDEVDLDAISWLMYGLCFVLYGGIIYLALLEVATG